MKIKKSYLKIKKSIKFRGISHPPVYSTPSWLGLGDFPSSPDYSNPPFVRYQRVLGLLSNFVHFILPYTNPKPKCVPSSKILFFQYDAFPVICNNGHKIFGTLRYFSKQVKRNLISYIYITNLLYELPKNLTLRILDN